MFGILWIRQVGVRSLAPLAWLAVACWLPLSGCGSSGQAAAVAERQSADTAEVVAGQTRGFISRTYVDKDGGSHGYVLFVPHDFQPGRRLPALMFLNGFGDNGDDGVNHVNANFGIQVWEMQDYFPFLGVAPQCRSGGSWSIGGDDARWALEILAQVIKEFGADEDRIYLTGVSTGGKAVYDIGSTYPERFAAIAPLCGNGGDAQRLVEARMPVWSFVNSNDEQGLVDGMRQTRVEMIERGMSPLMTKFHNHWGHNSWDQGYRTAPLYAWLMDQNRANHAIEKPFEYLPPARLIETWTSNDANAWQANAEDASVLMGKGTGGERLLVANASSSRMELHGDVWLPAGSVRELALNSDDPNRKPEFRLSIAFPKDGTGGIARIADGVWLAELDPAAQHKLWTNHWNDVRLRLYDGRLEVRLNGWPAIDTRLETSGSEPVRYHLALVAPADESEVRWRYLRMRDLSDTVSAAREETR
jgi:pimeloyl-ACP methyl ester carboxylesterase